MPIILLFGGLLLLASAAAGTTGELAAQLRRDFTGRQSFLYWLAALGVLGAVGYIDRLREFSRSMLVLVLLAMVLRNGTGVFARLQQAITSPPAPAGATDSEGTGGSSNGSGGRAGGSGGAGGKSDGAGGALDAVASVAKLATLFL